MSTVTIQTMLRSPELKADRGFNSLFAAYATAQRKSCGKCKRRKSGMAVCVTLLNTLIRSKRKLLGEVFSIADGATLSVFHQGTAFGFTVK